jgi:hypothetical protein
MIATSLLPSSIATMYPRKTTDLPSTTSENDTDPSEPKKLKPMENPTVKKALKRWFPEEKEQGWFGFVDYNCRKKPAISFLADPTKVGLTSFALWSTVWSVGGVLADYALQLTGRTWNLFSNEKITPQKSLVQFVKQNWGQVCMVVGISVFFELLNSINVAKYQQETNAIALDALENKGIHAKFGDA